MTEKLLQFIWKHRYFNQQGLTVLSGESLVIDDPGEENHHQGPDFTGARIRINGICWIGSIELHLAASGWDKHGHAEDENYRNVILHVVWSHDGSGYPDTIPQLELFQRVPRVMLDTYGNWMNQRVSVPCENSLLPGAFPHWDSFLPGLLKQRLDRKMKTIAGSLDQNHDHWEEQCWWLIAAGFGQRVNAGSFERIARSIPFNLLSRHRHQRIQLEALLFGQAGLLEQPFTEPYPQQLRCEYIFLKKKYGLKKIFEPVYFLRMRPAHFPTIRLSQLAGLFSNNTNFFAWILACGDLQAVRKKLQTEAGDYWNRHYVFEKASVPAIKMPGPQIIDLILINGIIPLLYTYGMRFPDDRVRKKALCWMAETGPEQNHILSHWKEKGVKIRSAADSQALLELNNIYCRNKKCLDCDIGKWLLRPGEIKTDYC